MLNIVLPIGISFFTFTQIAFLVDTYQGKVHESRFVHYVLFVTYFPHLIAGPVLHHKEMMPQFTDCRNYSPSARNFAVGCTIFCIGLAKKVLVADNLAPYANPLFGQPDSPSLLVAWGGVLAYTFQLYFDFSGYSDMAIGLSRLFGIRLPLNFNSPYKAGNISEFWRRWHMTLSRFLRDYLYIPLGGNRIGRTRRYVNLMITMVLGGLWHGAGWNFIIWGALHGIYLAIHHAWLPVANRLKFALQPAVWKCTATLLTFLAVCVAWVFFRAPDFATALNILQGMFGSFGVGLPDTLGNHLGGFKRILENSGIMFYMGGTSRFVETWAWVVFAGCIAFFMPNTQQVMLLFRPALDFYPRGKRALHSVPKTLIWVPSHRWAALIGVLAVASLLSLSRPTEFLYFQF
jgi:D-alanyl-lipoteichoic acid acyltransferase DltB (MBOAT superfamily)